MKRGADLLGKSLRAWKLKIGIKIGAAGKIFTTIVGILLRKVMIK